MKRMILASLTAALLLPAAPASADHVGPIVHTEECPPGYIGRTVYVAGRGVLWGCYIRQP